MPLRVSPLLGGDWVAATHTSLREIYRLGRPLTVHYLQQIFTNQTLHAQVGPQLTAVRAAVEGLVFGLAQGLPASAVGQSFAWPYLLQRTALLPDAAPGAWAICLLAAAAALAVLLRASWVAVWRSLPTRRPEAASTPGSAPDRRSLPTRLPEAVPAPGGVPDRRALLAAVLPCWLLQWRLGPWAFRFEVAAAVGLLLAVTGQSLYLSERWARAGDEHPAAPGTPARIPLWLAFLGGLLAGFGALPGISAVAILLAAALYGGARAEGAGRFALMAVTGVLALQGLGGLGAAIAQFQPDFLLLAAGAALGAAAGGWLLLALLRASWRRALPVMASYCTALGGLLLMFGVLQR